MGELSSRSNSKRAHGFIATLGRIEIVDLFDDRFPLSEPGNGIRNIPEILRAGGPHHVQHDPRTESQVQALAQQEVRCAGSECES